MRICRPLRAGPGLGGILIFWCGLTGVISPHEHLLKLEEKESSGYSHIWCAGSVLYVLQTLSLSHCIVGSCFGSLSLVSSISWGDHLANFFCSDDSLVAEGSLWHIVRPISGHLLEGLMLHAVHGTLLFFILFSYPQFGTTCVSVGDFIEVVQPFGLH